MVLKPQNLIVQRCRSKAFLPACLFPFSESSALYPIATQPQRGEGKVGDPHVKEINASVLDRIPNLFNTKKRNTSLIR